MRLQDIIAELYRKRGYSTDLLTIGLGICEEAGEVAAAINDHHNPQFKKSDRRQPQDLEHELKDLIVYACAAANSAGINLDLHVPPGSIWTNKHKNKR